VAYINKPVDLITIMDDAATATRKTERQLAVARTDWSYVAAGESTTSGSPVPLTTADSVSVICTANCLVHVFAQVEFTAIASGLGAVYLRDNVSYSRQVLAASSATTQTRQTVAGSTTGVNITDANGGYISIPVTTAGRRTYRLEFASSGGSGTTFTLRRLNAWVQPF